MSGLDVVTCLAQKIVEIQDKLPSGFMTKEDLLKQITRTDAFKDKLAEFNEEVLEAASTNEIGFHFLFVNRFIAEAFLLELKKTEYFHEVYHGLIFYINLRRSFPEREN